MGSLPVYTLSEFASSQRQLPVSTNRPQEEIKGESPEFREGNRGWPMPPLRNRRVETCVESWSRRRIQGTKAELPGTRAEDLAVPVLS